MIASTEKRNHPASVHRRLLNWAREHESDFNLILQRYAGERFLYRLGLSSEVDRFTLKGAALFLVWAGMEFRATRDIDLLGAGSDDHDAIHEAVAGICAIDYLEDGLRFDAASIRVEDIREDQDYGGVRVRLVAYLGNARIPLQVDIGFGDVITPDREEVEYPTILDIPAPRVWAYPRETMVAEKFEAMVQLGSTNTRLKDFWDVVALSQEFEFDGETLRTAIDETFHRRGTPITQEVPEALRPAFYKDEMREQFWRAFQQRAGARIDAPTRFEDVGERVRNFLGPVRDSLVRNEPFTQVWFKGGPWRSAGYATATAESDV